MTQISTTSRNDGFSIELINDPVPEGATSSSSKAVARIRIGSFTETFLMDLSFWSIDEYRRSWESALEEIEGSENATSCLIASITDPAVSNFISCWPIYRDGDVIHIQSPLIILDELDEPFDPREPWRYVEPHRQVDEDGNRISEWVTTASAIRQFRESAWGL
ncbi:hypothetical protein SAMN05421505_13655 [Sinosporangium album]|uniref:CdiI C-terminal domain-containing protein n=1 Tax=Sinosporangium album TaxID=504805 RepID=A0A1G8ICN2_9ACTN|nr:hypothetical protein [Sinosporangium album]SDI16768.1 hypothetical protein SAMN05421505_13655 [Sinosporangium album]